MGVGHSVALAHSHPKKGLANISSDYINRTPIEVQNRPGLQLPCCYQKVAIPLAIKLCPMNVEMACLEDNWSSMKPESVE
jgi:hypothetical protein